jgi:hypothetical protein
MTLWLSANWLADPFHALSPGIATLAAIAWIDAVRVVDLIAHQAGKVKL